MWVEGTPQARKQLVGLDLVERAARRLGDVVPQGRAAAVAERVDRQPSSQPIAAAELAADRVGRSVGLAAGDLRAGPGAVGQVGRLERADQRREPPGERGVEGLEGPGASGAVPRVAQPPSRGADRALAGPGLDQGEQREGALVDPLEHPADQDLAAGELGEPGQPRSRAGDLIDLQLDQRVELPLGNPQLAE